MEDNLLLNNSRSMDYNDAGMNFNMKKTSNWITDYGQAIANVVSEAGENFFHYLKNIGLSKEPDLLVLSSKHHYYYDVNELKSVRIVINLKKLNLIKHLDEFLFTLVHILPENVNFIGCFSDSKAMNGKAFHFYQPSRLSNTLINFLDSRTYHNMDKNKVSEILKRNGFKIIDMTEIKGLIYFCSQKVSQQVELVA